MLFENDTFFINSIGEVYRKKELPDRHGSFSYGLEPTSCCGVGDLNSISFNDVTENEKDDLIDIIVKYAKSEYNCLIYTHILKLCDSSEEEHEEGCKMLERMIAHGFVPISKFESSTTGNTTGVVMWTKD